MTLGRGRSIIRIRILILVVIIVLVAALTIERFRSGSEAPEETAESAAQGTDAQGTDVQVPEDDEPEVTDSSGDSPDDSDTTDEARSRAGQAPVIVGSRVEGGPRAARMERWQPFFGHEGRARTVAARSTIVDDPIRAVPLENPAGLDLVAVRVGRRRWDELASGVTGAVPRILWESAERVLSDAGELQWVHAGAVFPQAEYILRFENDRLLLRLYGTSESVDDLELEELSLP